MYFNLLGYTSIRIVFKMFIYACNTLHHMIMLLNSKIHNRSDTKSSDSNNTQYSFRLGDKSYFKTRIQVIKNEPYT